MRHEPAHFSVRQDENQHPSGRANSSLDLHVLLLLHLHVNLEAQHFFYPKVPRHDDLMVCLVPEGTEEILRTTLQ